MPGRILCRRRHIAEQVEQRSIAGRILYSRMAKLVNTLSLGRRHFSKSPIGHQRAASQPFSARFQPVRLVSGAGSLSSAHQSAARQCVGHRRAANHQPASAERANDYHQHYHHQEDHHHRQARGSTVGLVLASCWPRAGLVLATRRSHRIAGHQPPKSDAQEGSRPPYASCVQGRRSPS